MKEKKTKVTILVSDKWIEGMEWDKTYDTH